jgi:hypothetical protein
MCCYRSLVIMVSAMNDHEARMKQGAGQFNFHDEDDRIPEPLQSSPGSGRFRRINQESAFGGCVGSSRLGFSAAKLLRGLGKAAYTQPRFYGSYPTVQLHKLAAK